VLAAEKPVTSYDLPGTQLNVGSKMAGKTIWYVPTLTTIPEFQQDYVGVEEAASGLGMKTEECNAQGTPSGASTCITEAVKAGAAGIILDADVVGTSQSAVSSAESAGIPVVVLNEPPVGSNSTKLSYMQIAQPEYGRLDADYVITESGGKSHVLVQEITDDTASELGSQASVAALKDCPGCTFKTISNSITATQNLPSEVSAALISDPSITWIIMEYDTYIADAQQGIQEAGKSTSTIRAVSATGTLGPLEEVKQNDFAVADVADNGNYYGWLAVNAMVHMLAGQVPTAELPPVRLFTSSNVSSLDLTSSNFTTGVWFGSTAYKNEFLKLWGAKS
jgi:ribose transport system substrate-binding protein